MIRMARRSKSGDYRTAVNCLLAPTSGDALVLGDSILADPEAVKRKVNISPQETAVALKLSVTENLEFMARIDGQTEAEARLSAGVMMEALHLSERAKDRVQVALRWNEAPAEQAPLTRFENRNWRRNH